MGNSFKKTAILFVFLITAVFSLCTAYAENNTKFAPGITDVDVSMSGTEYTATLTIADSSKLSGNVVLVATSFEKGTGKIAAVNTAVYQKGITAGNTVSAMVNVSRTEEFKYYLLDSGGGTLKNYPPTAPGALKATVLPDSLELSWGRSYDDFGSLKYIIKADGEVLDEVDGNKTGYVIEDISRDFEVIAVDDTGLQSNSAETAGLVYTESGLKIGKNNNVWTIADKDIWWNSQSGDGKYVEKELGENVFKIARGNDKYFVVMFDENTKKSETANVSFDLWGTYRWQTGNIVYKGADGEIKDEQIGVKFDHFEPYSKTMKTDFDLTEYGYPGECGFVIVYRNTSTGEVPEYLWVKNIKAEGAASDDDGSDDETGGFVYTEIGLKIGKNSSVWTIVNKDLWWNAESGAGQYVEKELGENVFKIARGNDKYFVVMFDENIKQSETANVSFDLWGTYRWQTGNIIYKGADGEIKDEKIGVKFDHFEPYSKTMKTDFDLTDYGSPGEYGFVIVYRGSGSEYLWIKNIRAEGIGSDDNESGDDETGGIVYTESGLKIGKNSSVWTIVDKDMWWNAESGAGQYVEKEFGENVFKIARGNDKYFVVMFDDDTRKCETANVFFDLWGTYRWQTGNIIYKGADGEIKDEQIGVKFDHFEPYSKTMKTDFDLTDCGYPGECGFVIVYRGSGSEYLWIKNIKAEGIASDDDGSGDDGSGDDDSGNDDSEEIGSFVGITADATKASYTAELLPCGRELTGTNGNAISGEVLRDGSYGIGYQYKNVNGVDAFYLTQMYDTNADRAVDVTKGYMGFKVDTDKFPKSPTSAKGLYLITEYYDGTVGDIQTKPFEITYTSRSKSWATSSGTKVQMLNDNTWKTHIMPLGDVYFGVENNADSAAITYRIPNANDGYNKYGILIRRVMIVDEEYYQKYLAN